MRSAGNENAYLPLAHRIAAKGILADYPADELVVILRRLDAQVLTPAKGDCLAHEGDVVTHIGLLLDGNLHVSAAGLDGAAHLMRVVRPGEFVGASLIFLANACCPADVLAFSDSEVVLLDVAALLAWQREPSSMRFFDALGRQVGEALVAAWQKAAVLSCPNISERVMLCLAIRSRKEGKKAIVVPGSEADFANYLGVNAAALSRVLNRLRNEGRLSCRRNALTLTKETADAPIGSSRCGRSSVTSPRPRS